MRKTRGTTPGGKEYLGVVVAVLAMCMASAQLGMSAVNAALPAMASWAGSAAHVQWVVVSYLLALTAASLVVGYCGDLLGRVRVLQIGLLLFAGAGVVCALSPSMWILVLGRVVQGVGAAVMTVLPLALVRDAVSSERSGTAMGALGTAAAVGTASGPALGGVLMGAWGWPVIFWAMLVLPTVVLVVLPWLGRDLHGETGSPVASLTVRPMSVRFDGCGAILLIAAVTILAFVFTGDGMTRGWTLALLAGAGTLFIALGPIERRASHPVLPPDMMRNPSLLGATALNFVVGAIMMSTLVVGPFYLMGALGLGAAAMGVAMAAGPLTSVCVGVLAGRLVDHGDPGRLVAFGLALMSVAAAALAFLPPFFGLPGYLIGTVLLAPGYQLFMAANNTQVMRAVPGARRGTAAGMLSLSRSIGQMTGASLVASLFALVAGGLADAARTDLESGLRVVFGALALLLLAVSLASYRSGRTKASAPA